MPTITTPIVIVQQPGDGPELYDYSGDYFVSSINLTVTNNGDFYIPPAVAGSLTVNVAVDGYLPPYQTGAFGYGTGIEYEANKFQVNYVATNEAIASPYDIAQPLPYFISGIMFSPVPRWTNKIGAQSQPLTLTFSIMQEEPSFASSLDANQFYLLGQTIPAGYSPQQLLTMYANGQINLDAANLNIVTSLNCWASLADIKFVSATDSSAVNIRFGGDSGGINQSAYAYDPVPPIAQTNPATFGSYYFYYDSYNQSGDVYFAPGWDTIQNATVHEIGHTLGLGGESGNWDTNDTMPFKEDNGGNTIMSYNPPYSTTPQPFDIAAVTYLYGPNPDYHPNPSHVWTFNPNGGAGNFVIDGGDPNNMISAAGQAAPAYIDLRQGHFSYLGASQNPDILQPNQLWIGYGTVIDKAIGGNGANTLICNDDNDVITCGPAGNLVVTAGGDVRVNGAGSTTVLFADPMADYTISSAGGILSVTETVTPERGTRQGTAFLTDVQSLEFSDQTIVASTVTPQTGAVASFITAENANGRGSNGVNEFAAGFAGDSFFNGVVGWQSMSFTGGTDAVVLSGSRGDYTVQVTAAGATTITDIGVGDSASGQSISVSGESYVIFNNGAATTVNGAVVYNQMYFVESAAAAQIAAIYNAALGRQPDLAGLEYWENIFSNGTLDMNGIAAQFVDSTEFAKVFPTASAPPDHGGPNDTAFVVQLYENVLGQTPDKTGEAYWVGNLASGVQSRSQVLASFAVSQANQHMISTVNGGWQIDLANLVGISASKLVSGELV